jgi:hypothetical protein
MAKLVSATVPLKPVGDGKLRFLPVEGVAAVGELISTLRSEFGDIFALLAFVDLNNYDSRSGAVWATVDLHLRGGIVVTLAPHSFYEQLLKLDFLLHTKYADGLANVRRIDLSTSKEAVVEHRRRRTSEARF